MYVHVSDEENERRHENCINIVKRHCRIGKVYPRPPKHWGTKIRGTCGSKLVGPWRPNAVGAPVPVYFGGSAF